MKAVTLSNEGPSIPLKLTMLLPGLKNSAVDTALVDRFLLSLWAVYCNNTLG
jgi:hypothetical protein